MSWDNTPIKDMPLKKHRITFEGKTYEYYIHIYESEFSQWLDDILDRLEKAERKK